MRTKVSQRISARGAGRPGPAGFLFELSGGRLCLDFANTVDQPPTKEARERLSSYADLLSWSRQAGILSAEEGTRLLRSWRLRPDEAEAALHHARRLRETIFGLFRAIADRRSAARELGSLEPELATAYRDPSLRPYELVWRDDPKALDRMLAPVVRSAVELLASPERNRVRVCAGEECDWLFLDRSRNRSRRWCDMAVCGNRDKVNRFYHRQSRLRRRRRRLGR